MSPEGDVVVGRCGFQVNLDPGGSMTNPAAFRWTAPTGMQQLPNLPGGLNAEAHGVSGYGSFIVGRAWSEDGAAQAVIWTNGGTPQVISAWDAVAYAVNRDGSVVVGRSGGSAFRWTAADGVVSIGAGIARAVNVLGDVVVGTSNGRAFRWTEATGMQLLPLLPNTNSSQGWGVSADGQVIVGETWNEPNGGAGGPFLWTSTGGSVKLQDITDLQFPHNLTGPLSISADGTVVTSRQDGGQANSGIIRLVPTCLADFNADGFVDFFDYLDFVDAFSIGC